MKQFNIGLIGCGFISEKHIKAIAELYPHVVLAGVCDTLPTRMDAAVNSYFEKLLKSHHDVHKDIRVEKYIDFRRLINNEAVDIVDITLPTGYHSLVGFESLAAGKHTLIEKPISLSLEDASKLIEASKSSKVRLGVCFQNRFSPAIQALRKAIDDNRFGKLIHAVSSTRWNRSMEYFQEASWRGTWKFDGGVLMNQCIHNIDLLQWILGDVDSVYSLIGTFIHPIEAEDFGSILIKFKNGCIGMVEGTSCVYPKNLEQSLNIFGEKGTVCLGGPNISNVRVWNFSDEEPVEFSNTTGNEYQQLFRNFIDSMQEDASPPLIDGIEGSKALEIVLAAYKSSKTGNPVSFPLKDFSTIDMNE